MFGCVLSSVMPRWRTWGRAGETVAVTGACTALSAARTVGRTATAATLSVSKYNTVGGGA